MKTIYIASDFEQDAYSTSLYGISLAKAFDARLFIFSAYNSEQQSASGPSAVFSHGDTFAAIQNGEKESLETVKVESSVKTSDAVIAGLKEREKEINSILGNNVISLAKSSNLSILLVPAKANYINNNFIEPACDSDIAADDSKYIVDTLQEIGEKFDCKLYIVY